MTGLKGGRGTQGQTVSYRLHIQFLLHVIIIKVHLIGSVFFPQGSPGFPGLPGGVGTAGTLVS